LPGVLAAASRSQEVRFWEKCGADEYHLRPDLLEAHISGVLWTRTGLEPRSYELACTEFYADKASFHRYVETILEVYERQRSDIVRQLKDAIKITAVQ
jgi:hypothetical protein